MSIRISADGFSLSIYNILADYLLQREDYVADEHTPLHQMLNEVLQRPRLMDYEFREVEMLSDSPCTCVPLDHFRREEMTALYSLTFPETRATADEIHYQIIPSLEIVEIYTLNPIILKTVQDLYPDVHIQCTEGSLLEKTAEKTRKLVAPGLHFHVIVDTKSMLVCTFKADHLHFASTYAVDNDADRAYFALSVWKTLALDVHNDICFVSGASPDLIDNLKRFIHEVSICE